MGTASAPWEATAGLPGFMAGAVRFFVHSDADHQKDHTIQKGRFFVVQFQDDPKFKDMPHLFLQKGGRYQELMLPNDLPSENDPQKKIVSTKDTIGKEELERYLRHPKPAGAGEERLRGLDQKQLDRVKRYEKAHKNRKTVLEAIDRHFD